MQLLDSIMRKKAELQITPLIDCVFLLLVYFIVTAAAIKKEADLSFMLPAAVQPDQPVNLPLEVLIEVSDTGDIVVDGTVYGQDQKSMDDLTGQLVALRQAAEVSSSPLVVNILPQDAALQEWIVRVMDACASAQVKNISFSMAL